MQTAIASDQRVTTQSFSSRTELQASTPPLPCRGCTVNCPDYPRCNGNPWRLSAELGRNLRSESGRSHR